MPLGRSSTSPPSPEAAGVDDHRWRSRTRRSADLLDELTVRPSIVIIEDVHWADKASLDLIVLLGRRMSQTASLLVVTFRDDELAIDHPLRHTLSALVGRPGAERIRLQPLSIDGVARSIGRDRQHAEQMYQRTGGNPFFITEVMAEPDEALPASVVDAVLGRIARLEQPERQLLEALSIVPGLIPTNLVEVLGGSNADQLDRLFDSGMLVRSCNDIAVSTRDHSRDVAATVGPLRTVELHRMAMEALIAGGADPRSSPTTRMRPATSKPCGASCARLPMQQFEWGLIGRLRLSTAGLFALAIRTPCSRQSCSSSEGTRPCSAIASTSRRVDGTRGVHSSRSRRRPPVVGCPHDARTSEELLWNAGPRRGRPGRRLSRSSATVPIASSSLEPSQDKSLRIGTKVASRRPCRVHDAATELARRHDDPALMITSLKQTGVLELALDDEAGWGHVLEAADLAEQRNDTEQVGSAYLSLLETAATRRRFDIIDEHIVTAIDYCTDHGLDLWTSYLEEHWPAR